MYRAKQRWCGSSNWVLSRRRHRVTDSSAIRSKASVQSLRNRKQGCQQTARERQVPGVWPVGARYGEGFRRAPLAQRIRTLNPARWHGVEVFRPEARVIAVGDRIQFRAPQRSFKVANGEFATIIALDTAQATLRLGSKREISAPLVQLRHTDLGYASTSHAAQGATVDRVIVNVDIMRSDRLVNARQLYVSMSRARFDGTPLYQRRAVVGPQRGP